MRNFHSCDAIGASLNRGIYIYKDEKLWKASEHSNPHRNTAGWFYMIDKWSFTWLLAVKMAGGSFQLFQFTQKYCQAIGIHVPKSNDNRSRFNSKNLVFVLCLAQYGMASVTSLVYNAKSMGEYGIVFLILIDIIDSAAAYFIIVWKLEDMLKFIGNCEGFVEKRK